MKYDILVLDAAEAELSEAIAWYEARRSGLGRSFLRAVDVVLERLSEGAAVGTVPPGLTAETEARVLHVRQFPYSIVFWRDANIVWVVAIAHQHRRPGYWLERWPQGPS